MNDTIVMICAYALLGYGLVTLLAGPLAIGDYRKYTALSYVTNLIVWVPIVIVIGRVIGWW